jgi:hypothetical protein
MRMARSGRYWPCSTSNIFPARTTTVLCAGGGRKANRGQGGEKRRADELHRMASLRRMLIVAGSMAAPEWKPVTFPARLHHLAIGFRAFRSILTLFAAFATSTALAGPRRADLGVPSKAIPVPSMRSPTLPA